MCSARTVGIHGDENEKEYSLTREIYMRMMIILDGG
jgi:hypothetical protein